ncbi:response regulator transcription factor [Novosphingobium sp. CECT 9465]|uniref:response regulator transcription factor n=1 Tax=Novosphingobium sp. CECT 9465 TaxID=2829794 RepID=UPI001E3D6EF9|nr:response regulator [Novosphingobium sp. CECT 9465]
MFNSQTNAPLILVVEDSVLVAMAIEDALQERGFAVVVTSTLAGAKELIGQQMPAAALLDLQLPDGISLDLASHLHRNGCRVAISSGFDSQGNCEGHDFAVQFRKPVSPDILVDWVTAVIAD